MAARRGPLVLPCMSRLALLLLVPLLAAAADPPAAAPIDTGKAEHYVWGGTNDGWHLVKRDGMSVIQERLAPGAAEVRHYHQRARQFFYVLAGEFTMEAGGETFTLSPGQGIEIPPGMAHQAQNRSSAPVDILVNSTPESHGDRVEAPR